MNLYTLIYCFSLNFVLIALNIIKFLIYSLASCDETIDHLINLYETKSFKDKEKYDYFCEEYDHLGKMINNFIKSVDLSHKT